MAVVWVWLANSVVVWTLASGLRWTSFPALGVAAVGTVLVRHRLAPGRAGSIRRRPRSGLHAMSVVQSTMDAVFGFGVLALTLSVLWGLGAVSAVIIVGDDALDPTIWELIERSHEFMFGDFAATMSVAAVVAGSLVALAFARRLQRSFRGAALPPAADVLSHDRRPPILLLRAFDHDRIAVPTFSPWGRPLADVVWPVTVDELESVLARVVGRHAPSVALSQPSSQLGRGSARDRAPTSDWLSHVLSRARAARLIVVVGGDSSGLRAELNALAERPELRSKSVVLVPPGVGHVDEASMTAFGVDPLAASTQRLVAFTDREWFVDDRPDEFCYAAAIDAVIESTEETWQLRDEPRAEVRTGLRIGYEVAVARVAMVPLGRRDSPRRTETGVHRRDSARRVRSADSAGSGIASRVIRRAGPGARDLSQRSSAVGSARVIARARSIWRSPVGRQNRCPGWRPNERSRQLASRVRHRRGLDDGRPHRLCVTSGQSSCRRVGRRTWLDRWPI